MRRPRLSAWTEPALSSHNRQLAIFITAVGALIGAAMLITGGLAVLIGHAAPRWVAVTLLLLLLGWLSGTGMFDASIATRIGGPYGLSAFLTIAGAVRPARGWPMPSFRCADILPALGKAHLLDRSGA